MSKKKKKLSPFAQVLHDIILEMAVERNTPYEVSFTSEEIRKRFIAKGYDPETGEKIDQNKDREAGQ